MGTSEFMCFTFAKIEINRYFESNFMLCFKVKVTSSLPGYFYDFLRYSEAFPENLNGNHKIMRGTTKGINIER